MERLNSVVEGAEAAARLVACGTAAVGPLRAFLLDGRPSGVFQPRLWAVQALGGLGADGVLIEFLAGPRSRDPVGRLGDEAVRGAAAKALRDSRHPAAQDVLMKVAREEHLPGALEAIAARDPDSALPVLIESLEDDFARDAAATALRRQGIRASAALVEAALEKGNDSERARRRRRTALELLVDIRDDDPRTWQRLECLLDDDDAEIVCAAGRLGMRFAHDPARIARRLTAVLPRVGWEWMSTVEDLVVDAIQRAGPGLSNILALAPLDQARPDVQLAWNRIRRRVAEARARSTDETRS